MAHVDIGLFDLLSVVQAQVLVAMLTTLATAILIVLCRDRLEWVKRPRNDASAVQASHVGEPLRLGGIAIFAGVMAGIVSGIWNDTAMPVLLIASAGPAVLAGLWEDLGHGVSARCRLAAALVSATLAALLLGTWASRAHLPILDQMMAVAPVGLFLTITVSAGFCHATNLVDGMNGLAALVIISAAAALAVLAHGAGQEDLALMAALLGAAMAGFFLLNWPFGKLFMGDAGSYGAGHVLIWIAILLADRATGVAVPALLLILFWPFADTLHSIMRRMMKRKPVFEADRMHLHQKIRRCVEIIWLGGAHRKRSNPIATLVLAPMIAAPVILGVKLSHNTRAAWLGLLVLAALFALTHVAITRLAILRRRKLRCPKDCTEPQEINVEFSRPPRHDFGGSDR